MLKFVISSSLRNMFYGICSTLHPDRNSADCQRCLESLGVKYKYKYKYFSLKYEYKYFGLEYKYFKTTVKLYSSTRTKYNISAECMLWVGRTGDQVLDLMVVVLLVFARS